MPVYTLQGPDGRQYQIEGPEGATAEQLAAFVQSQPASSLPRQYDPTEGMSGYEKAMAGAGKAVSDLGLGLRQVGARVFGSADDVKRLQQEVAERRALDAPLMNTGAGLGGNIGGQIAMALLPGSALRGAGAAMQSIPAAARVAQALQAGGSAIMAPQSIAGAGAVGAVQGAFQPSVSGQETATNAAIGGLSAAAAPTLVRGAQMARALMDPFSQAGQARIIGRAMNTAAGTPDDAALALQNMRNAAPLVPGSMPTAGMAAQNPGLAALERTATATDPVAMNAMAQRAIQNSTSRGAALQGLAPDKAAAISARDAATNALYRQADGATIAVTPELQALMQRPSMQDAQARAYQAALERGAAPVGAAPSAAAGSASPRFAPQTPSPMNPTGGGVGRVAPTPMNPSGFGTASPDAVQAAIPAMGSAPRQTLIRGGQAPTPMNPSGIPPTMSGRDAHLIKMSLDDMVNVSPMTGIGGNELGAIKATRGDFLDQIGQQVPAYTQARQTYAQMSRPINQADVIADIAERANFRGDLTPSAFTRALNDTTAQRVTGQANATMAGVMEPAQMQTLDNIRRDLLRQDFAQTAGRGVGSDTVQKLAFSNLMNSAGVPSWIGALPGASGAGGMLRRIGQVAYRDTNDEMRQRLAQAMLNPQDAAALMEAGTVTPAMRRIIEGARGSGVALSPLTTPALMAPAAQALGLSYAP